MTPVPARTDALARFPTSHAVADLVDPPGHFMAGHARILNPRHVAFFNQHITVANAAGLDLDEHLSGGGLRHGAFH